MKRRNTDKRARERYAYQLKRKYGLEVKDYVELGLLQGWACAICLRTREELQQDLVPDHCHMVGHVRGLLCKACNQGLGLFRDDPLLLGQAKSYLERSQRR